MTTRHGIPPAPGSWPAGWTVLHTVETGSTNADLLALAAPGGSAEGQDKVVLVTDHQTAGRGRLDRRWEALAGANLLVSMIVRDLPDHVHEVTQRVALAAAAACHEIAAVAVEMKWPNDLLLDGAKIAGILAQTGLVGGRLDHVVVGIGINVAWAPEGAACLDAVSSQAPVDRFTLLAALLRSYDALGTRVGGVPAAYRAALATLGRRVRVTLPAGDERGADDGTGQRVLDGTAVDVEPDGRLVVLDACAVTHRIDTGDVIHLRPA